MEWDYFLSWKRPGEQHCDELPWRGFNLENDNQVATLYINCNKPPCYLCLLSLQQLAEAAARFGDKVTLTLHGWFAVMFCKSVNALEHWELLHAPWASYWRQLRTEAAVGYTEGNRIHNLTWFYLPFGLSYVSIQLGDSTWT